MSETADYTPAPWAKGHDFNQARQNFLATSGQSYQSAVTEGLTAQDVVPDRLSTTSTHPLIIVTDVTGSMDDWPATIFSKLPYLDHEVRTQYLGPDAQISFGAVGDANKGDSFPVQFRPFVIGEELTTELRNLKQEHGGGGGGNETYELAALYLCRNLDVPVGVRPIVIFIGDEAPYDQVEPDMALEFARVELDRSLRTSAIFTELQAKCEVYLVHKPYGEKDSESDRQAYGAWESLLGKERIALLADPNRVVDVLFGLLGHSVDKVEYFREEIEGRQNPVQVTTVYESLKEVLSVPPLPANRLLAPPTLSMMHGIAGGTPSTPLLPS